MMRFYARNGAGTVYWLLLPAPRGANFAKVFTPVNRALRRAARAFPASCTSSTSRTCSRPAGGSARR